MEIKLCEVLSKPDLLPEGWLFLSPNKYEWELEMLGVFIEDSYDFENDVSQNLTGKYKNWIEILDKTSIEDVVDNVRTATPQCTLNEILNAMIFYFENDSFMY